MLGPVNPAALPTTVAVDVPGVPSTGPVPGTATLPGHVHEHVDGLLDAEKLDVCRVALEFQALVSGLVPKGLAGLRDQLERASVSVVLNVAEGAGRRSRADKRRFYSIARGSAMECAAVIDVLRVRYLAPAEACAAGRSLVVRVVQMLSRLERAMGR
jgi:four helix bundle protein